jgi:hypothetical protein|tara:strand:- start:1550 stop:1822 length:273 start_codon:yes stop_codon:yes gene_type:complete
LTLCQNEWFRLEIDEHGRDGRGVFDFEKGHRRVCLLEDLFLPYLMILGVGLEASHPKFDASAALHYNGANHVDAEARNERDGFSSLLSAL